MPTQPQNSACHRLSARKALCALLLALAPVSLIAPLPVVAAPSSRQSEIYEVDLPGGDLHAMLLQLASQYRISLFYAQETVQGLRIPPLQGRFTLDELFDTLLNIATGDGCLRYELVRARLVALTPDCETELPTVRPDTQRASIESHSAPPPVDPVEEMIVREHYVTGSRIRSAAFGETMPLDVIDQTEIRLSGYQAVSELLRYVPAVSGNSTSTLISNGGDGTATVTLRGLPASNTLVLLNGRRVNADALGGAAVDLNTLPLSMVEQIEILKDGASAIYGSDAVAGVVNIITKSAQDGLSVDLYSGISADGDRRTDQLSFIAGQSGQAWQASVGVNFYDQQGIDSADRKISSSSDDRARGGIDKRSSATAPARVTVDDQAMILSAGAAGTDPTDYRPATLEDRYEYRDFTSAIVPSRRTSAFANGTWEWSERWQFYGDALYTRTEAVADLAPVPVFTAFEARPLPLAAEQAFNPFGVELNDIRRRVVELPSRLQENDTRTYRAVLGARRQSVDANLDIALQYNETDAREIARHGINSRLLANALGSNCTAPCTPFNLLGPPGSITGPMLDYVTTNATISGTSQMLALSVNSDWAISNVQMGTFEVSSGFELRREKLQTRPDAVLRGNELLAGGNRSATSGARDIIEAYAEGLFPLLRDQRWAYRLHAQAALRASHYSDFGYEVNPRVLLVWQPTRDWTARLSASRGFRAPTLLQLYGSQQQSFQQLNDPCSVAGNAAEYAGCFSQSDPSLTQFLTLTGGNSELEAERSRTLSTGLLWQREWQDSAASLSVDWYQIDQRDVVDSSAQYILNQNARNGLFATRITRNADGNLSQVLATLQNIGRRKVSGLDLTGTLYRKLPRWGHLTLSLNATRINSFRDKFNPGTPFVEKAGTFNDEAAGGLGALPRWKWNAGLSWEREYWHAFYNIYHVSELDEIVPLLDRRRVIDAWTTHNFNLTYRGPYTAWTSVTLGVNNLLDEAPPFAAAAFNDSYDGRTYDLTGRYLYLRLERSFSSRS